MSEVPRIGFGDIRPDGALEVIKRAPPVRRLVLEMQQIHGARTGTPWGTPVDSPRTIELGSAIRVIAAVFAEALAADHALAELTRLDLRAYSELKVAAFGRLGRGVNGDSTVLAGRLPDEHVPDAELVIEEHGGLVISDVDARRIGWTDGHTPG